MVDMGGQKALPLRRRITMPVHIKRVDGYRVTHGEKVSAKSTTKAKAEAQARLLRGIAHGMVPRKAKKRK